MLDGVPGQLHAVHLQATINSPLWVLDDAELDSAKAGLTARGDVYLEIAEEHLRRLENGCDDMPQLTHELGGFLDRASRDFRGRTPP